jgi:hypothetical protein
MSTNAEFIASIEALLAAAKSYNVEQPDRVARANMLGMVEDLHYKLESPEEAMFRQLTNVRSCQSQLASEVSEVSSTVLGDLSRSNIAPNGRSRKDTPRR